MYNSKLGIYFRADNFIVYIVVSSRRNIVFNYYFYQFAYDEKQIRNIKIPKVKAEDIKQIQTGGSKMPSATKSIPQK